MILTLIGYRGTGKTSVAGALKRLLGWECRDADHEVQVRAGCSIREIFERQGEPVFRDLEEEVIADLLKGPRVIVSAGGGAILRETTRERMKKAGPVIWLQASADELVRRISADQASFHQRPGLTDLGLQDEVKALLKVREPLYRETSSIAIDSEGKSPESIAREIIRILHLRKEVG